ncbi:TetR/AcrR family transcriptional regulator [Spirillospora sp. NBC_01491]|uniref:TetR/AcrR family transcriptional regulator n=1 Tax=Spirillospora sp. NBC_01491 TaxID=2976007 RepID=UPI002E2F778F|nr:TetR/AcrR family transcriptional regulator [Spirillospora sp. NBC_01491]
MIESTRPEAKAALLERVVEHLAEAGVGDRSLRGIAAGAGTSHRMLIYHFGSKERLLVEVVRAVERRQRTALARLEEEVAGEAGEATEPADVARAFWRLLSDPALAPHERLFFELYGAALAGRSGAAPLLDGIVDTWLEPGTELVARGLPPGDPRARARARALLAFARGALLDLLATGERAEVDRMVDEFIDLAFP